MTIMQKYRTEWKYKDNRIYLRELSHRLSGLLEHDKYTNENGRYLVSSLYFDDLHNTCAKHNVAGEARRFKWRVRFYNNDKGFIKLEKKIKINSYCLKKSQPVSEDELARLLNNDFEYILYGQSAKLLKELAEDIMTKGFTPKCIVTYEREAFFDPFWNVRITFDSNITVSDDCHNFLLGDYIKIPVIDKDQGILEVKFDDVLPSLIRNVICAQSLTQQAFSKYYMGRVALQNAFKL